MSGAVRDEAPARSDAVRDEAPSRKCLNCWGEWSEGHVCPSSGGIGASAEPVEVLRRVVDVPLRLFTREYTWLTDGGEVTKRWDRVRSCYTLPDRTDALTLEGGAKVVVSSGWAWCEEHCDE